MIASPDEHRALDVAADPTEVDVIGRVRSRSRHADVSSQRTRQTSRCTFGQSFIRSEVVDDADHPRTVERCATSDDLQRVAMDVVQLSSPSLRRHRAPDRDAGWPHIGRCAARSRGGNGGCSPCTGQAAPSPKAQMVWPSIWVVTSSSMSISRLWARPSAMRVSTRHIQPMPSRQGVHWPQLSCL